MVPSGKVSAITMMQAMKMIDVMTVRRSRFFSQMPEPEVALYIEEAMSSDTPVPLPECMRIRIAVMNPDRKRITTRMMLRTLTSSPFTHAANAA